jgi:hypothetical protein
MGAWGYGILDNDSALDEVGEWEHQIEQVIERAASRASLREDDVAEVGAAVGLLLQFSGYSFDESNGFSGTLKTALTKARRHFGQLPGRAGAILERVLAGQGPALHERPAKLARTVANALHDDTRNRQRPHVFGRREADLFAHLAADEFVRKLGRSMVRHVFRGSRQTEDDYCDFWAENEFMGTLSMLLVLEPCEADPDGFRHVLNRLRRGFDELEEESGEGDDGDDGDDGEAEFARRYRRSAEIVLKAVIRKFSKTWSADAAVKAGKRLAPTLSPKGDRLTGREPMLVKRSTVARPKARKTRGRG